MVRLFNYHLFNRVLLSTLLLTFTLTYPIHSNTPKCGFNLNDGIFLYNLERAVEKLAKCTDKGLDKCAQALVDVKSQIEGYCNIRIDLNHFMKQVETQLYGYDVKKYLEVIKKRIEKKEKSKRRSISEWELALEMSCDIEDIRGIQKQDREEQTELEVPYLFAYGVTMTLCGFFLMLVPFPACKVWGERILAAGVAACATSMSAKLEEDRKREREQE